MINTSGLKRGNKVRLTVSLGGQYPIGTICTITTVHQGYVYAKRDDIRNSSITIYPDQMELVSRTKEDLEKDLKTAKRAVTEAKNKVTEVEDKIKYLKNTGLDEYDELQSKSYQTLQLLKDGDKDDIEKSKILADLIRRQ
jgi:hypothetical protein